MSETLEELRAQRALIQKHLNWLDTQIASAGAVTDEPVTSTVDQSARAKETALPVMPTTEAHTTVAPTMSPTEIPPLLGIDEERHLASGTSDVKRAQIGCFLFFIGSILLFLFLLFGLPYMMD